MPLVGMSNPPKLRMALEPENIQFRNIGTLNTLEVSQLQIKNPLYEKSKKYSVALTPAHTLQTTQKACGRTPNDQKGSKIHMILMIASHVSNKWYEWNKEYGYFKNNDFQCKRSTR